MTDTAPHVPPADEIAAALEAGETDYLESILAARAALALTNKTAVYCPDGDVALGRARRRRKVYVTRADGAPLRICLDVWMALLDLVEDVYGRRFPEDGPFGETDAYVFLRMAVSAYKVCSTERPAKREADPARFLNARPGDTLDVFLAIAESGGYDVRR